MFSSFWSTLSWLGGDQPGPDLSVSHRKAKKEERPRHRNPGIYCPMSRHKLWRWEQPHDRVIQANQSDGISPELEEKIHEMQVKNAKSKNLVLSSLSKISNPAGLGKVHVNSAWEHKLSAAGISNSPRWKNSADVVMQVLSMYLSCSGYEEITNACLDRVVCEYANEESDVEQEERDVISMWVSIVFQYSMDLRKHWGVRYDQRRSVSWVGSNWNHEMSLNALLDASRLPNLPILVNKKRRALSGPPRVHSGLVIFRRKCTQMFFCEQLLPGEVAQAICECQLLTRFMCGWKSTLLSSNFCLLCSTVNTQVTLVYVSTMYRYTQYTCMFTELWMYSNLYV